MKNDFHSNPKLLQYKNAVEGEMNSILNWWMTYMIDEDNGGFYGLVNNRNEVNANAEKGIVLNSRICWTFSAAYIHTREIKYLQLAERAFEYISKFFIDKEYGGVYWSVNAKGQLQQGRKQIYGMAFTIYAFAEYYKASHDIDALYIAQELYHNIEKYSFDKINTGYIEAFARDWSPITDLRLSEKDANDKKTMNSHLHIIEAYTNLYIAWPSEQLKYSIKLLLDDFNNYIINPTNHHLHLFMDECWNVSSNLISYGHDIEASWLLQECAEIIRDDSYISKYKKLAVKMADAAHEGWDKDNGGLRYEYDPGKNSWVNEKHWWPQAEAMVGYLNAFQITQNEKYLTLSQDAFVFIVNHIKDTKHGEWFWGINNTGQIINQEKAGFWKCPYHNTRACIEISKRIKNEIA